MVEGDNESTDSLSPSLSVKVGKAFLTKNPWVYKSGFASRPVQYIVTNNQPITIRIFSDITLYKFTGGYVEPFENAYYRIVKAAQKWVIQSFVSSAFEEILNTEGYTTFQLAEQALLTHRPNVFSSSICYMDFNRLRRFTYFYQGSDLYVQKANTTEKVLITTDNDFDQICSDVGFDVVVVS